MANNDATQRKVVYSPTFSRYKDTPVLEDDDGHIFYDLWNQPAETENDFGSTTRHIFSESEVGRLDLIAANYFETAHAWWVLADQNALRDQVEDMQASFVGAERTVSLVVARKHVVQNFLTR